MESSLSAAFQKRAAERRQRRVVMARLIRQGEDDGRFDQAFWDAVGAEGRFAAAWQLVAEAEAMQGRDVGRERLRKDVVRIWRR